MRETTKNLEIKKKKKEENKKVRKWAQFKKKKKIFYMKLALRGSLIIASE